jgi:hypothetical protein
MGRTRRGRPNRRKFASMDCPLGCSKSGTVPGMKRHVKAAHGPIAYEATTWPDIHGRAFWKSKYVEPGSVQTMSINELRQEAKRRGISSLGKSKKKLALELLFDGPDPSGNSASAASSGPGPKTGDS